jgi:hypothetical protein
MDFSGPFMQCSLVTPDNIQIPLWTNTTIDGKSTEQGKEALKYTGLTSLPYVSDLVINSPLSRIPRITVSLTPPYREAVILMNKSFLNWGSVSLKARVGYWGSFRGSPVWSPVFTGLLLAPSATFGENVTITMTSQGPSSLFINAVPHPYPKTETRISILNQLLKGKGSNVRHGLGADGINKPLVVMPHLKNASQAIQDYWTKPGGGVNRESLDYGQKSDFAVLKEILDHSQCRWLMLNNELHIYPIKDLNAAAPKRVFTVMDYPGGSMKKGYYPILSVSTPNTGMFLPGVIDSLTESYIDPATKQETTAVITETSLDITRVGDGSKNYAPSNQMPGTPVIPGEIVNFRPSPRPGESHRTKAQLQKYITDVQSVKLNIETLGIPDILPGEVVKVVGCSDRIDGNYAVWDITHRFNSSGLSTSLVLQSTELKISKDIGVQGNPNKQKEDTGAGRSIIVEPRHAGLIAPM